MSENTDALKKGYDAFNSGDLEGVAALFAEDVRWEGTNDDRVPGAGTFDGRDDAMKALGEAAGAWDSIKSNPDEFIEEGDTVVVLGHTEGSANGNDVQVPFVHVWRMEGGQVKRAQLLTDTAVVLKALGS
jgi:uncharacterized protein